MRFLRPAVGERAAWDRLHRPRFRRTRRLVRHWFRHIRHSRGGTSVWTAADEPGQVPRMATVWLPHYLVIIETEQKGQRHTLHALVGAHDQHFRMVDLTGAEWEVDAGRERLDAPLDGTGAERVARRAVFQTLLRGPAWRSQPAAPHIEANELVQYPYWVYYFERRKGILDVRMADGLTGRLAGPKTKAALFDAITADERTL